jgi:hypothetical protein
MEAAEDAFEADGLKFNAGTFILRNADRAQLEKAAAGLGLHIHSTNAALNVATHPISAPRVGIVHNWQNTQNDGWFRVAFDELKIPYTYVADTWLRENANLREPFDVLILPPMGGGGAAGLSSPASIPRRTFAAASAIRVSPISSALSAKAGSCSPCNRVPRCPLPGA